MDQPLNLRQLPSPQPQYPQPLPQDPLAVRYEAMEAMAALNNLGRTLNILQNKVLAQALSMEDDPVAQQLGLHFLQRAQATIPLLDTFRDVINRSLLPHPLTPDTNDSHTSNSVPSPQLESETPSGTQMNEEPTTSHFIWTTQQQNQ